MVSDDGGEQCLIAILVPSDYWVTSFKEAFFLLFIGLCFVQICSPCLDFSYQASIRSDLKGQRLESRALGIVGGFDEVVFIVKRISLF